jgi:Domain of unknown function (DUF4407)
LTGEAAPFQKNAPRMPRRADHVQRCGGREYEDQMDGASAHGRQPRSETWNWSMSRQSAATKAGPDALGYLSGRRGEHDRLAEFRIAIATVFAATFAGVAAGYASSYVVDGPWPVIVGSGWSLVILNLDSTIVALIRDRSGPARWTGLASRIPIALPSAVIFAEVLMLRVFAPEVTAQIAEEQKTAIVHARDVAEARHRDLVKSTNKDIDAGIAHQQNVIADLQERVDRADDLRRKAGKQAVDATKERRVYYNRDGDPYFDSTHSRAAQAEERRLADDASRVHSDVEPEIARAQQEIDRLRSLQSAELKQGGRDLKEDLVRADATPVVDGLMARMVAFEEVCAAHPTAQLWRALLAMLLLGVELAPTLLMLGERHDAATIRERLHELLEESLRSPKLKEWLTLWMHSNAHRYVDRYMDGVDHALGAQPDDEEERATDDLQDGDDEVPITATSHGETDVQNRHSAGTAAESDERVAASGGDSADERVRHLLVRKVEKRSNGIHTS